ncbi:MAG: WD40 repeat domain-containing protein, partial [Desulfobacterales bacterium]|nr:WD40 repeat domain-containing protein [Desulfobacterales bacterium]
KNVAAKVEKNGRYTIVINGKPLKDEFGAAWDPVFSPDSGKILIRAIETGSNENKYFRHVMPITDIAG